MFFWYLLMCSDAKFSVVWHLVLPYFLLIITHFLFLWSKETLVKHQKVSKYYKYYRLWLSAQFCFAFHNFVGSFNFIKMSYFDWNLLCASKKLSYDKFEKFSIPNLNLSEKIPKTVIKEKQILALLLGLEWLENKNSF